MHQMGTVSIKWKCMVPFGGIVLYGTCDSPHGSHVDLWASEALREPERYTSTTL
jgi:hypothetical protein